MITIDWLPVDPDNLPEYDVQVIATNGDETVVGYFNQTETFEKATDLTDLAERLTVKNFYDYIESPTHYVLYDDFLNSLPK